MSKFIDIIHSGLTKNQDLSEEALSSIRYSLEVIINTISKLLITLTVFIIWGQVEMFFYILFFTITTRTFIGGVHFDSFMGCTLFTTVFFGLICFLAKSFVLGQSVGILIFAFALVVFFFHAPVISINRPAYSDKFNNRFKKISLIITLIYLAVFLSSVNSNFTQVVLWGFCLSTIQLLIGREVNRYYEKQIVQIQ